MPAFMSRAVWTYECIVHCSDLAAGVQQASDPSHNRGMATLEQTLQTFQALLANERAASVGAVDEAVWAYLASVQGLDAQTEALDELSKAVARLNASSPFMPVLMDTIDRHWQRLAGPTA
jgi:hypothetical protein